MVCWPGDIFTHQVVEFPAPVSDSSQQIISIRESFTKHFISRWMSSLGENCFFYIFEYSPRLKLAAYVELVTSTPSFRCQVVRLCQTHL